MLTSTALPRDAEREHDIVPTMGCANSRPRDAGAESKQRPPPTLPPPPSSPLPPPLPQPLSPPPLDVFRTVVALDCSAASAHLHALHNDGSYNLCEEVIASLARVGGAVPQVFAFGDGRYHPNAAQLIHGTARREKDVFAAYRHYACRIEPSSMHCSFLPVLIDAARTALDTCTPALLVVVGAGRVSDAVAHQQWLHRAACQQYPVIVVYARVGLPLRDVRVATWSDVSALRLVTRHVHSPRRRDPQVRRRIADGIFTVGRGAWIHTRHSIEGHQDEDQIVAEVDTHLNLYSPPPSMQRRYSL